MKRKCHTLTTGPSAHTLFLVPIVSWAMPTLIPSSFSPGDICHLAFPVTTSHNTTSTISVGSNALVRGRERRRRDRGGQRHW